MMLHRILLALTATGAALVAGAQPTGAIKINQVGYYTHGPKTVVVTDVTPNNLFYVLSAAKGNTLYKGVHSAEKSSLYSSAKTLIGDFSRLQKAGTYVIVVPGTGTSYKLSCYTCTTPI